MTNRKTRPGTITLNFEVSDQLHAKIKAKANSQNLSISALVRRILGSPPLRNYRKKIKLSVSK